MSDELHDRIDRLEGSRAVAVRQLGEALTERDDWQGRALAAVAAADGYRQRAERETGALNADRLAEVLSPDAFPPIGVGDETERIVARQNARRILADPGPLLAALAEAGVLHRQGKARIHYRYGVNSGTLTTTNSPTAIDLAVRNHEQLTMGPIDVERVEVGTQFTHLTEWRLADD